MCETSAQVKRSERRAPRERSTQGREQVPQDVLLHHTRGLAAAHAHPQRTHDVRRRSQALNIQEEREKTGGKLS